MKISNYVIYLNILDFDSLTHRNIKYSPYTCRFPQIMQIVTTWLPTAIVPEYSCIIHLDGRGAFLELLGLRCANPMRCVSEITQVVQNVTDRDSPPSQLPWSLKPVTNCL